MNLAASRPTWRVRALHIAAMLVILASGLMASANSTGAQGATSDIAIVTTQNGSSVYDACYVLVDHSNVGCDENGDGKITFEDIPVGTYTLRQTANLGAGRSVADTTITVTGQSSADGWEYFYVSVSTSGSGVTRVSPQVAIFTTENGRPAYDACYVLVGYSLEGCDENRDGKVTFDDIPLGTYTVRQTADLGPNRRVNDFTIEVRGHVTSAGWESFSATIINTAPPPAPSSAAPVDIALITRAPEDGHLLRDACYVLVGYSNEGCDENGDGQVTFAAIPPGTYTVRQTKTPAGYPTINDYQITVQNVDDVPLSFLVRQAREQNAPNTRNVSVVFVDISTKTRVVPGICVELVGASNIGCDEDLMDGQVDFLDVPAGTWEYRFSNLPQGWIVDPAGADFGPMPPLTIDASSGQASHRIVFIPIGLPTSSNGGAFEEMVGIWAGKRRDIEIRADGTGQVHYRPDAFGNGIIWDIVVDPNSVPVTATIVNVSTYGNVDPADYPAIGDTITFTLERYPDGLVIVATIGTEGRSLNGCPMDADGNVPNVSRLCY